MKSWICKWALLLATVMCFPQFAHADVYASVGANGINTVNPLIFGDNISWRGDGYGVWDAENDAPTEGMVEAFAQSHITHLRYPGGIEADYFHWYETLGEARIPQIDPFSMDWPTEAAKQGERYMPNFGFEEFIAFCRATDILPTIILNVGTGTPEEAADWIMYCVEHGLNVTSYDVGNEVHFWHEQVPGIKIAKTEAAYIDFYLQLVDLLRERMDGDLSDICLGAIGLPNTHPLSVRKAWNKEILSALGAEMDYLDVHIGYSTYNVDNATTDEIIRALMASAEWIRSLLNDVKRDISVYAGDNADEIDIHITEMGPMTGSFHYNTVAGALMQADLFNMLLREEKVTSANHLPGINHYAAANTVGTAAFPVVSASTGRVYWKNAVSYVFDIFAPLSGTEVLDVQLSGETFSSEKVGLMPAVSDVTCGDVGAYRAQDGTLTLVALCRDSKETQQFTITLPEDGYAVTSVRCLYSRNSLAYNTWRSQSVSLQTLAMDAVSLSENVLTFSAPPISLWEITLQQTGGDLQ